MGEQCFAPWSDGHYYVASITSVIAPEVDEDEAGEINYWVMFDEYGETAMVLHSQLLKLDGDSAASSSEDHTSQKGFILKHRTVPSKKWQRWYFTVEDQKMCYKNTPTSSDSGKSVDLAGATVAVSGETCNFGGYTYSCFTVTLATENRTFDLAALKEDVDAWVLTIGNNTLLTDTGADLAEDPIQSPRDSRSASDLPKSGGLFSRITRGVSSLPSPVVDIQSKKEGFLNKQGEKNKGWKQRYFRLVSESNG